MREEEAQSFFHSFTPRLGLASPAKGGGDEYDDHHGGNELDDHDDHDDHDLNHYDTSMMVFTPLLGLALPA